MFTRPFAILAAILFLAVFLGACGGAQPDASKSYSRAVINRGAIVPAENIRVNEYLNYYEQRFPEPTDAPLGLDLRLGNTKVPATGGDIWLQIGLQAGKDAESRRTPLNLALVLDTSGSMKSSDKLPALRQSLRVFLDSLQPDDIVSIVAYSDEARVLRSAGPVADGRWIRETVDGLQPSGYTNLHAGMIAGFQEVERNFDIRRNNRVLLLTDGVANRGEIRPDKVATDARSYNDRGIYLSTIGLGLDLNDQLLSTLASQGKGAYHFIDSAGEMDKVFRQEVSGLVEKVAEDVVVSIVPERASLTWVSGYDGAPPAGGAQVRMPDIGAGDSQVLMARFSAASWPSEAPVATVTVSYTDLFGQRQRQLLGEVRATTGSAGADPLADVEVRRNATVAQSAQALIDIDHLFEADRYEQAWRLARQMEQQLRELAALSADERMVQDADLFRRYQLTLAQALGYEPDESRDATTPDGGQPERWGPGLRTPLPTPDLPAIEVR